VPSRHESVVSVQVVRSGLWAGLLLAHWFRVRPPGAPLGKHTGPPYADARALFLESNWLLAEHPGQPRLPVSRASRSNSPTAGGGSVSRIPVHTSPAAGTQTSPCNQAGRRRDGQGSRPEQRHATHARDQALHRSAYRECLRRQRHATKTPGRKIATSSSAAGLAGHHYQHGPQASGAIITI